MNQPSFDGPVEDRKSTRLNSSHSQNSYAVFCLDKKTPVLGRVDHHEPYSLVPIKPGQQVVVGIHQLLPRYTLFPYTTLFRSGWSLMWGWFQARPPWMSSLAAYVDRQARKR